MISAKDIIALDNDDETRNALVDKAKAGNDDAVKRLFLWGQWRLIQHNKTASRRQKIRAFSQVAQVVQESMRLDISYGRTDLFG